MPPRILIDGQDAPILRPCRERQHCNESNPIHAMDHEPPVFTRPCHP